MNLLLDGFGGLRPIFQNSGFFYKPITIVSPFPYEFSLGRLWRAAAHIQLSWLTHTILLQIQRFLFMNLLLGGFGGLRPIGRFLGLGHYMQGRVHAGVKGLLRFGALACAADHIPGFHPPSLHHLPL